MQIIFDLVGKCRPRGKPCAHFDGEYQSNTACGTCERNPKLAALRDSYKSPAKAIKEAKDTPLPERPEGMEDHLTETEEANKRELAEWGISPTAVRRGTGRKRGHGPRTGNQPRHGPPPSSAPLSERPEKG